MKYGFEMPTRNARNESLSFLNRLRFFPQRVALVCLPQSLNSNPWTTTSIAKPHTIAKLIEFFIIDVDVNPNRCSNRKMVRTQSRQEQQQQKRHTQNIALSN